MDNVSALVAYVDSNRKYRAINRPYQAFFGVQESSAMGSPVKNHLEHDLYLVLEKYIDVVFRGQRARYELEVENSSGIKRNLEGTLLPFYESPTIQNGYLVIVNDITDQQNLIRRLEGLQASLDTVQKSEQNLKLLARRDEMTGLLKRRGWEECTSAEKHRLNQVTNENACVAIVDIDGLKALNDKEGHAAGDKMLILAAEIMSVSLRKVDLLARLGGDEFAILFIDSGLEQSIYSMRRIERALNSVNISASWGVSQADSRTSLKMAMTRADKLMYLMKRNKSH